MSAATIAVMLCGGCASMHRAHLATDEAFDPGVEIRFPATMPANGHGDTTDSGVEVVAASDVPMPPIHRLVRGAAAVGIIAFDQLGLRVIPRPLTGHAAGTDTKFTLIPGTYAFDYEATGFRSVFGEVSLYPVSSPRAKSFIRLSSIAMTPSPEGSKSLFSQADLDRARGGDVVTKAVFIVHLPAVRDRLDDIERSTREMNRLRNSLQEQHEYWSRKLAERRINTRYGSEFGWGVDVPAADLALLQTIVGPERYHWHRFTQAEDKVSTYQAKLASLDRPLRNLNEERDALLNILHSVDVIHRTDDMVVLAPSMIRPYHDPVYEVEGLRGADVHAPNYRGKLPFEAEDWIGPFGRIHWPYLESSLSMSLLGPGLKPVIAPSMAFSKNIGEVLLVAKIGSRRPTELGGHWWASAR